MSCPVRNSEVTFWWVWLAWLVGLGVPENPPWPPRSLYTLLITCLIGPHMYATKTDRLKAFLLKAFILALFCLSCQSGQSHRENSVKIGQQLVQNPPPRPPSPRGAVAVVLINMIANWLPNNCRPIARISGVAAEICQNFCRSQCIASSDIANAMTLNWYLLVPFSYIVPFKHWLPGSLAEKSDAPDLADNAKFSKTDDICLQLFNDIQQQAPTLSYQQWDICFTPLGHTCNTSPVVQIWKDFCIWLSAYWEQNNTSFNSDSIVFAVD